MRIVVALAISASLLVTAPAPAGSVVLSTAPAAPKAAAPTQTFTGGGTGFLQHIGNEPAQHDGSYTSNGQLGSGRFFFETSVAHGVARFTRSDGMTLTGTVDPSNECGTVPSSAFCVSGDLTGNRDVASAHVILAVQDRITSHAAFGDTAFLMRGTLTLQHRIGYVMVDAAGKAYAFGGIDPLGDAAVDVPATDIEMTPSHQGYWITNEVGKVFAFGDARLLGDARAATLARGEVVISISATPSGSGYWLFTTNGRAIPFGDAHFFGDLATLPLNGPIVGSISTPTGRGYYMVASDGGVFAFGDARFRGSMGGTRLNGPVVGLVPTPDNAGYWLVATDGGVFSFNAKFYGSMGATRLNRPIVAMVPYGRAYLMIGADGGVFNFSNAPFFGSEGGAPIPVPVVNGAAAV